MLSKMENVLKAQPRLEILSVRNLKVKNVLNVLSDIIRMLQVDVLKLTLHVRSIFRAQENVRSAILASNFKQIFVLRMIKF